MAQRLDVDAFLKMCDERPLIDVRTPAEFAHGHIPAAHSLPLFSDEERAVVGAIYKQQSPAEALRRGLDFVGPKMRGFVEEAGRLAPGGKIAVHCWRGGKRSDSMAWLLEFAGFEVAVLHGGYKAYRSRLLRWFAETPLPLVILGGRTGCGKTDMLAEIARLGEQVVDLEGLAHHKGSAFGALGEAPQPTTEQFENDLFLAFRRLDISRRIWLENESRAIGRVYVPEGLWQQKEAAPVVHVDVPLAIRVQRLVADYARFPKAELIASFEKIRKRLGGQHLQAALDALAGDDYATAAALALNYYDKAYDHALNRRETAGLYTVSIDRNDPAEAANRVVALAREVLSARQENPISLTSSTT